MSIAELSSLVVAVIAIASGLGVYLTARRQNTGKVTESNAEVLWKQSQAMYTDVVKERDNAIAQRDRLMSAQADQVIPLLSAVLQAVQQVSHTMDSISVNTERVGDVNTRTERVMDVTKKVAEQIEEINSKLERLMRKYG